MTPPVDPVEIRRRWPEHTQVRRLSKRFVEVDGRYLLPSKFSIAFSGKGNAPDVELTVEVDDDAGHRITAITITSPDNKALSRVSIAGIVVEQLGFVALAEAAWVAAPDALARGAAHGVGWRGDTDYTGAATAAERLEALSALRTAMRPRRSITGDHLREVARVYNEALAQGRRDPTAAVRAELDAGSLPTAKRWVGQARRAGLLPATTQGRAQA